MRNYRKSQGIWYLIMDIPLFNIPLFNVCRPEPVAIIPVKGKEYLTLYSRVLAKYMADDDPERLTYYDNLIALYKEFVKDWIIGQASHLVIEHNIFAIQPVILEADSHVWDLESFYKNLQGNSHMELYWNPVTYSYHEYNPDEWDPFEYDKPYDGEELFSREPTRVAIASPESIESAFIHISPFRYIDNTLYLIDPATDRPFGPIERIIGLNNVYVIYPESNDIGGIVDSKGKFILFPEFVIHGIFGEWIIFSKDNYYGLYLEDSRLLIPAEWDSYDISASVDSFLRLRSGTDWFYIDILGTSYPVDSLNNDMKSLLPLITCPDF